MICSIARWHALAFVALFTIQIAACDPDNDEDTEQGEANDPQDGDQDEGEPEPDMEGSEVERRWYSSCGDPVCSGYGGPWPDLPVCEGVQEGDPCDHGGATCDFMSDCNAVMVCASLDPKEREGGCPL